MVQKRIVKKPKIIFIDLDGTSLDIKVNNSKTISPINIEGIKKMQRNNINVVLSSGRGAYLKTYKLLEHMHLTDGVLWNGSKVVHMGKEIFSKNIDPKITQELFNDFANFKLSLIYNSGVDNNVYCNHWTDKVLFKDLNKKGNVKKYSEYQDDFEQFKIILWHRNKKKLYEAKDFLKNKYNEQISITISGENDELLEITAENCTKGDGNLFYAKYMNIDPMECVHIGDGLNDESAKEKVGYLVALDNASKFLKAKADIISPFSYKNGGLAKTFDYLFGEFLENE